jgi:sulfite exporter TauE/SafE
VDSTLIAGAALLGLAGTPHCAAMCGAPCAAMVGGRGAAGLMAFHLARIGSYAAGGALAAASVGALATLAQLSAVFRPLWTLLHVLILGLGLWLLWHARQPAWLGALGRAPVGQGSAQVMQGPRARTLGAALGGGAWVAWPCGLLQSALLMAGLTGGAWAGAAAMAAFAVTSSAGLVLAPWMLGRMLKGEGAARRERWIVRLGGAALAAASGWALLHGVWQQVSAYCAVP